MEDYYDYSQHKSCISFTFDFSDIMSKYITIDDHVQSWVDLSGIKTELPSILYDTTNETVIARGISAEYARSKSKTHGKNFFYLRNIFSELNNIYSRLQQNSSKAYDKICLEEAIAVLHQRVEYWKELLDSSNIDFYYAFTLPTQWDPEIREGLIRPLFIKANLIHESDGQGRLIFFTELQSTFRYMQLGSFSDKNIEAQSGKQYIICSLDLQTEIFVDLELVSAQYPPALKAIDSNYVPQLLNHTRFTIPFGPNEIRLLLTSCLKKYCKTIQALEIIDKMFGQNYLQQFVASNSLPLHDPLPLYPFRNNGAFNTEQSELKKSEIDAIQAITREEVLENFFNSARKTFIDHMHVLLQCTSNVKTRSMIIFHSDQIAHNFITIDLLKRIENWSKTYGEEEKKSFFKLIRNGEKLSFNLDIDHTQAGMASLLKTQMQDFNMSRDPIILPLMDAKTEQFQSSLKPIYFITIAILPTNINVNVTYLDENAKFKQTENIKCNIQPLDSFIIKSELYQRPVLYTNNRLKLHLRKVFGSYLNMYSKPIRQTRTKSPLKSLGLKLFTQCLRKVKMKSAFVNRCRIKTSQNCSKDIRNLFVYPKPKLLERLTKNVKMDGFFTLSDTRDSTDSLANTCNPGYMFFFLLTYLHNLNNLLEGKLQCLFGNDWQKKNMWYGVSVDKNLLDTVFGSKKNLEKLFFASGILRKDDKFRKAKFCTHGEEILPAIQQNFVDLEFKIKSYFVVVQVFSKHVQLTLHQVVKLATSGRSVSTIIIQDKIICIDDACDTLCKEIWKSMQFKRQITCCTPHRDNDYLKNSFGSLKTYKSILQNLNISIAELLERNRTHFDMNSEIKLRINDECVCTVSISLRNIIELGMKPIILNIASIAASSLTNKELFGNYETDYLFILGDPFNLCNGSSFHTAYTIIMQQAIDDNLHFKLRDIRSFVIRESTSKLLEQVTRIIPCIYDKFINGTLSQVSSETYAVRFPSIYTGEYFSFCRINHSDDTKNNVKKDGGYLIFIQKGKPIPTARFMIKMVVDSVDRPWAEIIKVKHLNSVSGKYSLLDKDSKGPKYRMRPKGQKRSAQKLIIECRHINYNYSLELSIRMMGRDVNYNQTSYKEYIALGEPLTLAYI
ncbi:uncharacterized protein EV154DRAFT_493846 [Mucor mucedo]|uniref:uncharacterized protein n=1 Tax=Mucor mucedo TaxID=29922 RepID=UPI002220E7CE|nr:uncharacterized protein EV154DRAFT_493846 [Mucor mucedo]KAI7895810.1 hypothetical protein EV154DRAFT_493846 [Mucor mucedo]